MNSKGTSRTILQHYCVNVSRENRAGFRSSMVGCQMQTPTRLTRLFGLMSATFKSKMNKSVVETLESNVLGSYLLSYVMKQ